MIFLIIVALIALSVIILFAFPTLSPIPYFPSNHKDLDLILKALDLKNNQTIVDLGAGDGVVVFTAAQKALEKKLNTKVVAVELNPLLYLLMQIRRVLHSNRSNITIILGNMFTMDYSQTSDLIPPTSDLVFYIYISPWYIARTIHSLQNFYKEFYIISYMYQVPDKKPVQKLKGRHHVYRYKYTANN